MLIHCLSKRSPFALVVIGAGLTFSTPAFAVKDKLYAASISNVTVNGSPSSVASTLPTGAASHVTFNDAVPAGQAVALTVTWKAQDNSARPGTDTAYPRIVNFTAATTAGPTGLAAGISGTPCTLNTKTGECATTISFVAPNTPNANYQLQITGLDSAGGSNAIEGRDQPLSINFSVATPAKLDTILEVKEPNCFLLNAGNVDLQATLRTATNSQPLPGKLISFALAGYGIGSASTSVDGVATLNYSVNSLAVGDYNLFAQFDGTYDSTYNSSDDSATLGVSYVFVGFQQPINADGNSVFGNGRVIPIKIRLGDANGQPVTNAQPRVWMTKLLDNGSYGEYVETASVSAADTGNIMRYVAEDNHYVYNWDLSALTNGTWKVKVELGDSQTCSKGPYEVLITVQKKGK